MREVVELAQLFFFGLIVFMGVLLCGLYAGAF
jgi:hypothetical protein